MYIHLASLALIRYNSSRYNVAQNMSEEVLLDIPEIRITTEQVVFSNATLDINRIASTDISDKLRGWVIGAIVVCTVLLLFLAPLLENIVFSLILFSMLFPLIFVPKNYALKITMTDKMFYEVITRTRREAEAIQKHVHAALYLSENKCQERNNAERPDCSAG